MKKKKFKPILVSTEMVQAILDGRKTQTRRVVKDQPIELMAHDGYKFLHIPNIGAIDSFLKHNKKAPYNVGDVLWIRETFAEILAQDLKGNTVYAYTYKANDNIIDRIQKWKPSIFMPKEACRLFLEVTDIRVERLNNISESDAEKEGVDFVWYDKDRNIKMESAKSLFKTLWQRINGKKEDATWVDNPIVWVVEFKVIDKP